MKIIKGFDGLRAFSIILVLLTHLGIVYYIPDTSFMKDRVYLLFAGTTGVNVFFAISGFLITRILLVEKDAANRIQLKNFYIRRFLRLLPPLVIFYSVIAFLMLMGYLKASMPAFLLSFFYLYNFAPYTIYISELGHTWSLAVEEQFYLFWPFIISLFSTKAILRLVSVIIMLSLALLFLFAHFTITRNGVEYSIYSFAFAERFFLPAIGPIMIGSLVSLIIFYKVNGWQDWFARKQVPFIALGLFLAPLYLPDVLLTGVVLLQALGISFFLAWIFYNQQTTAVRFLEWQPIKFIGKISYGIYVYQGIFLGTGPRGKHLWIQHFPQNIIFVILLAILSYYLVERPILKLKKFYASNAEQKQPVLEKQLA